MSKYDRVMRKAYKFYNSPKSEETYALDHALVSMIVPRLRLFIEDSTKIVDWEEHTKYAGMDVIKTCREIIEDFDFYLENSETDTLEVYKEYQKRLEHGFSLLGKVITHLGW